MEHSKSTISSSFQQLKDTKTLVKLSLLLALEVILSYFQIAISETLRTSPAFIATALMGMVTGPVGAALGGGVADVLKYLVNPQGAYFPGFTISGIVSGAIYGLFLYKRKPTLWNLVAARTCINVFVNIGMNTFWLSIMYGTPFWAVLPVRAAKNLALLPLEIFAMVVVLRSAYEALKRLNRTEIS